jgi:hypothetical protein
MGKGKIIRRTQHAHAFPTVKCGQLIVAANNGLYARGEGKFEVSDVLWSATVGDTFGGCEPDGLTMENGQNKLVALTRNSARESRAVKHPCDLGVNGRGTREDIHRFHKQQCLFRHAVHLKRRAHHSRGVKDDQLTERLSRRSALHAASSASIPTSVTPAVLAAAFSSGMAWASGLGPDRGRSTGLISRPPLRDSERRQGWPLPRDRLGWSRQPYCPCGSPCTIVAGRLWLTPRLGNHS